MYIPRDTGTRLRQLAALRRVSAHSQLLDMAGRVQKSPSCQRGKVQQPRQQEKVVGDDRRCWWRRRRRGRRQNATERVCGT